MIRTLQLLALLLLPTGSLAPTPAPNPPARTAEAESGRIEIGSFGAAALSVQDPEGRVASCGAISPDAQRIEGASCNVEAEEPGCPQALATAVDLPTNVYIVRLTSMLESRSAPALLVIVEVGAANQARSIRYSLELPPQSETVVRYEPGGSPHAEVHSGDQVTRVTGEVTEGLSLAELADSPELLPNAIDSERLCAAIRAEPEPSDAALLARLRRFLPRRGVDAWLRDSVQQDLENAVKEGRLGAARTALAAGAQPNDPLPIAVALGNLDMVRTLLDGGADASWRSARGESALAIAYARNHLPVAQLLLERGAPPEGRLLVRAVSDGRQDWIALLRRFEVPIPSEALARTIERALQHAPRDTTPPVTARALDLLFAAQAWLDFAPRLLAITACREDASLAQRLIDAAAGAVDLREVLHHAVVSDQPDCVERLLRWGADPNAPTASGTTALMRAVRPPNPGIARQLLAAGARVDARTADGSTALLLLASSPPLARDRERRALEVEQGKELLALLIAAGADLDTRDASGRDALIAAAAQTKMWLIELLLDRGATLTAETWERMAAANGDAWRIELEHLWRERELDVPSVLELFPTAPVASADARAQERTLRDLRLLGAALMSWVTDEIAAGAAAEVLSYSAHDYPVISAEELTQILTPLYLSWVPTKDGWGHPFEVRLHTTREVLLRPSVFLVRSPGRDGRFSSDAYQPGAFPQTAYDEDIVYVDGRFVRWPSETVGGNDPDL